MVLTPSLTGCSNVQKDTGLPVIPPTIFIPLSGLAFKYHGSAMLDTVRRRYVLHTAKPTSKPAWPTPAPCILKSYSQCAVLSVITDDVVHVGPTSIMNRPIYPLYFVVAPRTVNGSDVPVKRSLTSPSAINVILSIAQLGIDEYS